MANQTLLALDQYVIPGNILYKQRGTIWHPGENAIRGRDFTIHAAVAGYVKYYRDPELHPTRQYIGVAFERTDTLPYPKNAPRHRKLAKIAVPRKEPKETPKLSASGVRTSVTLAGDAVSFISAADAKAAMAADGSPVILPEPRKPMQPKAAATPRQFFLRDDYSYREANWRLGRLAGPVGEQIGSQRKYSRSARFRTLARKKHARQQKIKEMAAENKRVKVAARAQELARKAEDEARVAAELKKREARFAELEAAEAAGKQAESPDGVHP
jgi:ribosomal protein L27